MGALAWFVVGAVAMTALWAVPMAQLVGVCRSQRKALDGAALTIRLYRESFADRDRQVRDLLDQNVRLAQQVVAAKAIAPTYTVAVPPAFFEAREES